METEERLMASKLNQCIFRYVDRTDQKAKMRNLGFIGESKNRKNESNIAAENNVNNKLLYDRRGPFFSHSGNSTLADVLGLKTHNA